MKIDKLKQYVTLRESLLKEKTALEARLAQINRALGVEGGVRNSGSSGKSSASPRINNPMSLKAAIVRATTGKPMTKKEILEAIKKLGYQFTAKNPMNSLNVVLYTKGQFKNDNGKFSPTR